MSEPTKCAVDFAQCPGGGPGGGRCFSNNLANANTTGYARRQVVLAEQPELASGHLATSGAAWPPTRSRVCATRWSIPGSSRKRNSRAPARRL